MCLDEFKQQVRADAEERKRQFRQELDRLSLPKVHTDIQYTNFCDRVDTQVAEAIRHAEDMQRAHEEFRTMIAAVAAATAAGDTKRAEALFAAFAEKHGLNG